MRENLARFGLSGLEHAYPSELAGGQQQRAAFARILDENLRDRRTDDLFIVAHGGTQMAVLEEWGRPARDYYAWQTPCGWCWCLETPPEPGAWRREGLGAVGRHSFLREDPAPADLKK